MRKRLNTAKEAIRNVNGELVDAVVTAINTLISDEHSETNPLVSDNLIENEASGQDVVDNGKKIQIQNAHKIPKATSNKTIPKAIKRTVKYECKCGEKMSTFKTRKSFLGHMKTYEDITIHELYCDVCGSGVGGGAFKNKMSLQQHKKIAKNKTESACTKAFNGTWSTPGENITYHGCPEDGCGREFTENSTYIKHYRNDHMQPTTSKKANNHPPVIANKRPRTIEQDTIPEENRGEKMKLRSNNK